MSNKNNTLDAIADLLAALEVKSAASGSMAAHGVSTSHPIGNVDDGTSNATEGSRSSENAADVKSEVGPNSTETASETPSQESVQVNVGVRAAPTGEDPEREKGYKKAPCGPTTEAEATKYASDAEYLGAIVKMANDSSAALLAALQVELQGAPAEAFSAEEVTKAAQAGYDAAGIFAGYAATPEDVNQADGIVIKRASDLYSLAIDDAANVLQYLSGYIESAQVKQAMDIRAKMAEGGYGSGESDEPSESEGEESADVEPALSAGSVAGLPGGDADTMMPPGGGGDGMIPPEVAGDGVTGDELMAMLGGGGQEELSPEDLMMLLQLIQELQGSGQMAPAKAAQLSKLAQDCEAVTSRKRRKTALQKALLDITAKK